MIAVIDSGSTKSDWLISDGKSHIHIDTQGLNPNFIDSNVLDDVLRSVISKNVNAASVNKIFFFGSGVSADRHRAMISESFCKFFPNATIEVENDILGAVRATCGNDAGIVCILGTGCNSVFFDGEKVIPNNYGLGYILSDEGAGADFGKLLITNFLYGLMPQHLSGQFSQKYRLNKDSVIQRVYQTSNPNSWLAAHADFLIDHKSDPWILNLIENRFNEFFRLFILNYPGFSKFPVHFIGGISFQHLDILKKVAAQNQVNLGKIIKKPIDGLLAYHLRS